jgi:transglutaminase-like putative cysteine protease
MRTPLDRVRFLAAGLLLAAAVPCRGQDNAPLPKPSFDRIDYTRPDKYLAILPSLGNPDRIRKVASALGGKTPEEKLVAVSRWVEANLRYDPDCAYEWRDFDGILELGKYGGCADHAVVFGALARACGIP